MFIANVSRTSFVWRTGAVFRTALGVELIEEACARFPYEATNVPLFDGSMNTSRVATGAQTLSDPS